MQNVIEMPTAKTRQRAFVIPDRSGEFKFHNIEDLCRFVGGEIRASKMKYVDLAAKSHVCPQTVSRLASGDTHFPRAGTILQILRALGFELIVRG